jgi:hypothetical protein
MKNFPILIFFYVSFYFFTCQTLADEVSIEKQASHSSDQLTEPQKKKGREASEKSASLTEGIKIGQQRSLDPAIFTMIRPFTVDSSPVKLPAEQVFD